MVGLCAAGGDGCECCDDLRNGCGCDGALERHAGTGCRVRVCGDCVLCLGGVCGGRVRGCGVKQWSGGSCERRCVSGEGSEGEQHHHCGGESAGVLHQGRACGGL